MLWVRPRSSGPATFVNFVAGIANGLPLPLSLLLLLGPAVVSDSMLYSLFSSYSFPQPMSRLSWLLRMLLFIREDKSAEILVGLMDINAVSPLAMFSKVDLFLVVDVFKLVVRKLPPFKVAVEVFICRISLSNQSARFSTSVPNSLVGACAENIGTKGVE